MSNDAKEWRSIAALPGGEAAIDDIACAGEGRYVRVLMRQPANGTHYTLSEVEVMGRGGAVAQAPARPAAEATRIMLSGGDWRLERASEVTANGESLSQQGFDASSWLVATVPATVLSSYINTGAVADPNFDNQIFNISESYFNSDFWYRTEFELPEGFAKERLFLNFDGINWKADIYLNGTKAGRIDGAFIRGAFDITKLARVGKNALAVRIIKNENIGFTKEKCATDTDKNGGTLGADNPTFHASVGWDWISTVRGRNIGIYNDVYVTTTGAVTLHDPLVKTQLSLPDTTATLTPEVILRNHNAHIVKGTLRGSVGDIRFEQAVELKGGEERTLRFDPAIFSQLHEQKLALWWPKGYGKPHLYDATFSFDIDGTPSDHLDFKVGVRQMEYSYDGEALVMHINGRRFIGRGGNWGFGEHNLNYRGREFDIAVAYHADMNFTIIRNWVGQIGDEELFEACDRHGVMIWQDFWLANPANGPDPADEAMFLKNAEDFVRRIRRHACIAIYCGRNEGYPPVTLDKALCAIVAKEHSDIHYISHSSTDGVSGHGPYRALPPKEYFELNKGRTTFHSERGMPCVMNYESLQRMLAEASLWPQNDVWGQHDFTTKGAQRVTTFNELVEKGFGAPQSAKEFCELAQWINYNGYRAIFESRSSHRKGMLLWMSHPAWPSMVWQTYDYYFEPTGAYFGCMKANEPLHIQWNAATDEVEVVNYSAGTHDALTAKAQVVNMDGSIAWERSCEVSSLEDTTVGCFKLEFPATVTSAHFVKLTLSKGATTLSDNFYIRGIEQDNYQAISIIPKVALQSSVTTERTEGDIWLGHIVVRNTTNTPALMIRLNLQGAEDGEQILPVFYSDNYFSLLPGEERTVTLRWSDRDTRGTTPKVAVTGYNVE